MPVGNAPAADAIHQIASIASPVTAGSRNRVTAEHPSTDERRDSADELWDAQTGNYADAAAWGEVIVLAVKGSGAEATLEQAGIANLADKLVIDATNPIADAKPDNGVIRYFTNANESLMERLQAKAPQAKFVKAFNSVGNKFMVNPPHQPTPTMFICGNDAGAKAEATKFLTQFGWETAGMGMVESARPIEMLCQLWCAPGMLRGEWTNAFKLLKL